MGGGVPTAALLTEVETYMNVLRRRTLCDTLEIEPITLVEYTIVAEITVEISLDNATVLAEVQAAAENFAEESEVIDQDISLSKVLCGALAHRRFRRDVDITHGEHHHVR